MIELGYEGSMDVAKSLMVIIFSELWLSILMCLGPWANISWNTEIFWLSPRPNGVWLLMLICGSEILEDQYSTVWYCHPKWTAEALLSLVTIQCIQTDYFLGFTYIQRHDNQLVAFTETNSWSVLEGRRFRDRNLDFICRILFNILPSSTEIGGNLQTLKIWIFD